MSNVHDELHDAQERVIAGLRRQVELTEALCLLHHGPPTDDKDTPMTTPSPLVTTPEAVIRAGGLLRAYQAADEAEACRILMADLETPDGPLATLSAVIAISTVVVNALAETDAYKGQHVLDLAVNAVVAECFVADNSETDDEDDA